MGNKFEVPQSVMVVDSRVDGRHGPIPIRRYVSRRTSRREPATLVWVHGGAFAWGGLDQLESHAVAASIAASGMEVVAVDYRRAPAFSWFHDHRVGQRREGHTFPVPVDDVVDALSHVSRTTDHVVLGGASAGACLSATAAMQLRGDGDGARPMGLILAYGTFHAELPAISSELRARTRGRHAFAQFNPRMVERMNRNYAGDDFRPAEVFPGGGDLRGLPCTTLIDADRDTLRASGRQFSEELVAAGVAVDYRVVRNATHGFLDRPNSLGFAHGIRAISDALARHDQLPNSRDSENT